MCGRPSLDALSVGNAGSAMPLVDTAQPSVLLLEDLPAPLAIASLRHGTAQTATAIIIEPKSSNSSDRFDAEMVRSKPCYNWLGSLPNPRARREPQRAAFSVEATMPSINRVCCAHRPDLTSRGIV